MSKTKVRFYQHRYLAELENRINRFLEDLNEKAKVIDIKYEYESVAHDLQVYSAMVIYEE